MSPGWNKGLCGLILIHSTINEVGNIRRCSPFWSFLPPSVSSVISVVDFFTTEITEDTEGSV